MLPLSTSRADGTRLHCLPDCRVGNLAGGKRRGTRVTRGSSLATVRKTPPIMTTSEEGSKPEYEPQHYIDMYVKDQDGGSLVSTRGMLDSGSQGSCVNRKFSHDAL